MNYSTCQKHFMPHVTHAKAGLLADILRSNTVNLGKHKPLNKLQGASCLLLILYVEHVIGAEEGCQRRGKVGELMWLDDNPAIHHQDPAFRLEDRITCRQFKGNKTLVCVQYRT